MIVVLRIGTDGNGTVYYGMDENKLNKLKDDYESGGWYLSDKGTHNGIRLIEIS